MSLRAKSSDFALTQLSLHMTTPLRRAAFLDRDGVINIDRAYLYRQEDFEFVPGFLKAAHQLVDAGFELVVVTNQSGIARGYYTEADFWTLTHWMASVFKDEGIPLLDVLFCPHHPTKGQGAYQCECTCRKPEPGMLLEAAKRHGLALNASLMFGDKLSDIQAGINAGCRANILLGKNGNTPPLETDLTELRFMNLLEAVQDPRVLSLFNPSERL